MTLPILASGEDYITELDETGQPIHGPPVPIRDFIDLIIKAENRLNIGPGDTARMVTRIRKVFYGKPEWDKFVITAQEATDCDAIDDSDGGKKISGIGFQGVNKAVSRPVIDKKSGPPAAITPGRVGNQNVQVAVVVHIRKLSTGAAETAVAVPEVLVTCETESTLIYEELRSFIGKNQQITVSIPVRVPGSSAENAFH